jgi:phospholipid/cholesterol/gamma-HCH transport system substrate-binding protein
MNKEKKTEVKVGLTVLIGLVIFSFIYGWAKNYSFSSDYKNLRVQFETVAGLEIGDLVSVNGVRKGLVESILSKENYALVEIHFKEEVNLKEDATFSVMMLDLMGGKKIEISPGDSNIPIDYSLTQDGKFSGDISTAMATLSSVESDLIDVIFELKTSLKSVNEVFGSNEFKNNITTSLNQISILSKTMNELVKDNKHIISETLENLGEITKKTNMLIDSNSVQVTSIISKFDSTLTSTNHLMSKLNQFSDEIKNSENNIGKLLYDEKLLNDLQLSFSQIKELTEIITEQLKSGGLEVKADVDLF